MLSVTKGKSTSQQSSVSKSIDVTLSGATSVSMWSRGKGVATKASSLKTCSAYSHVSPMKGEALGCTVNFTHIKKNLVNIFFMLPDLKETEQGMRMIQIWHTEQFPR